MINRAEWFCRLNQRTNWETTVTGGKFSTDVESAHARSAAAQPAFCLVANGLTTVAAAYSMAGLFLSRSGTTNRIRMYSGTESVEVLIDDHAQACSFRVQLASRAAYSQWSNPLNKKHDTPVIITVLWCSNARI